MTEPTNISVLWYALAVLVATFTFRQLYARVLLSRAKHRSLAGHARISRRIAQLVPFYEYEPDYVFAADDAPAAIVERRRSAFARLTELYRTRFAHTAELTREVTPAISDLQFTSAYRVPFQFNRYVASRLSAGSFVQ